MTNDTQDDTDESGESNSAIVKRRDVIVGLGAAGVFAGAASGQSQDSVGATIGGGPMSSEVSHLQIEWAEGSLSERPDAGVENRYFRVADESDPEYGTVYRDDGSSWEAVDVGFGSVSADKLYTRGGWKDVTANRSKGVQYRADSGVRQVAVKFSFDTTSRTAARLRDVATNFSIDEIIKDAPDPEDSFVISGTIPGGEGYRVKDGGGTITIETWVETK